MISELLAASCRRLQQLPRGWAAAGADRDHWHSPGLPAHQPPEAGIPESPIASRTRRRTPSGCPNLQVGWCQWRLRRHVTAAGLSGWQRPECRAGSVRAAGPAAISASRLWPPLTRIGPSPRRRAGPTGSRRGAAASESTQCRPSHESALARRRPGTVTA